MLYAAGFGEAFVQLPCGVITQKHFSHNRGIATGISLLGYSSGNIVGPYLINYLLEHYGWRGTLLILAAILAHRAPLGLTLWLPTHQVCITTKKVTQPESSWQIFVTILKRAMDFSLLKNTAFLLFIFASMTQKVFRFATAAHFPSFAVNKDFTMADAAFLSSIVAISNFAFRVLVSLVANLRWLSPLLLYAVGMLAGGLSIVMLLCLESYTSLLAYVIAMGSHLGQHHLYHSFI